MATESAPNPDASGEQRFVAVAFDLLTALIDSWALWIDVAGDEELGRRWRRASLRLVTSAGAYRPYEAIVHEATAEVGLPAARADELLGRWEAGEVRPWPEAPAVLAQVAALGWRTAVVTNCSQRLAERAAAATGHRFDAIVSAERAGIYKTEPGAYRAGLAALGDPPPERVLFVAGSAHDVPGAGAVGMRVYWSNRFGEAVPPGAPPPLIDARDLTALPQLLGRAPATTP